MDILDWAQKVNYAVTVCDAEANIIYMNEASRQTNSHGEDICGRNLKDCHSPQSWETIRRLLATGESNIYTISKKGREKLIYQTPWHKEDGTLGGLVETSMVIPPDAPHFNRG
jgi:Transcriptional regulator containing PAS, AAA-type ATPase, and DNA-binding domains